MDGRASKADAARIARAPLEGSAPLYELRGVIKRYGDGDAQVEAINIDLEIGRGEFIVVAGRSGSGKSTLLQLLGTLDRPTEGVIRFDGSDLAGHSDHELAELRLRRVGFVFQVFNLVPTLSAAENVELALAPSALGPAAREARVRELLERVGLSGRATHLPSQLSGGEQQRVAIARALANQPEVVLADEPTGNLDTKTAGAILALLYSLWDEAGLTVILVTHDPALAGTAPRLLRLADGLLVAEEEPGAAPEPAEER
jgi:putative ABC transport system ATP-binding protein